MGCGASSMAEPLTASNALEAEEMETRSNSLDVNYREIPRGELMNCDPMSGSSSVFLNMTLSNAEKWLYGRDGWVRDTKVAIRLLSKLAEEGHPRAIYHMACFHITPLFSVKKDPKKARNLFRQAADLGDKLALARCKRDEIGEDKDHKGAIELLMSENQDDPLTQFALGTALDYGVGADAEQAIYLIKKAAEGRYPPAQLALANAYSCGHGVALDHYTAYVLWRNAAEGGSPEAMMCLANCFENGTGIAPSEKEAVYNYKRAADLDWPAGIVAYGHALYTGNGCEKNVKEAILHFHRAVTFGVPKAEFYLAFCYESGEGVQQDVRKAKELYRNASLKGHTPAQQHLERLERVISAG